MPLSTLNAEQLSAVTAPMGNNLVIASAGTGKTSTIVGRIANLLQNGVEPSKILLLTFTNKASGEMLERVGRYFPSNIVNKIEAGTFHAVSYRWLKSLNSFVVLKQPSELKTLFRSVYEKRDLKRLNLELEPFSASFLYEQYNLYQNVSFDGFDSWFLEKYREHESLMDIYMSIIEEYEETKERFGFLSFNDLLLKMREYLLENSLDFDEVLVDEYQDTNTLQSSLIDTLKAPSLFCVGDYDQSIYAFNGANIENIATFTKRYKDARVFTLTKNYRSSEPILNLANRVIERNERIYPKKLEVTKKDVQFMPRLLVYEELFEQYRGIADYIRASSTPREEIAVIFRNNSTADGIEASLRDIGISSKRRGGNSFFEAKEIKFLLDTLSLLVNPKDMMAFIHIFEYGRGIGTALAKEMFESFIHFGEGSLFDGILNPKIWTLPKLNRAKNIQLGLFDDDIEIGSISRFNHLNLESYIKSNPILKHAKLTADGVLFFRAFYIFLKSVYRLKSPKIILEKLIDSELYEMVVDTLSTQRAKLKSAEIDWEKKELAKERIYRKAKLLLHLTSHYKELERFVNAMVLGGNELTEGAGVNLLTVHASKGLEFDEVYVIDLMEGRFPNRKLMSRGGNLEEERRLFYVAVTRARDRLYLSYAKRDKIKKIEFEPSIFLREAGFKI
jgi:DNA helicase-2/ATP-dependent DNA helicase PcrA